MLIVAVLAIAGGLTIVLVTSPKSWELGPAAWLQGLQPSATPAPATATPDYTPTPTVTPSPTITATATRGPTATLLPTVAFPTPTPPGPAASPTLSVDDLPDDVKALAIVVVEGAGSARLRDVPAGENIVTAVANGTQVEVLFGQVEVDGIVWVQVRVKNNTIGWMANYLLKILISRPE